MEPQTSQYLEWLNWLVAERHISTDVIKSSGLYMYRADLGIPVRDVDGKILFYKHRRSFKENKGIKYKYDKGATASLYGAETLKDIQPGETVVVTEGELDTLAMRTLGYHAVSSTGGAGTWNQEWNSLVLKETCGTVLLYDADKAGVEGALRVASTNPKFKIAWCPVEYGKDPTDVIRAGQSEALKRVIDNAKRYEVPSQDSTTRLEALKELQKVFVVERKECMTDKDKTPFHVDIALNWVENEIVKEKEAERRVSIPKKEYGTDVARAKAYPIRNLVKMNREKKAKCLWHDDRVPSMHVYPDHVYCFVCNKRGDAIDVFMAINGCDFKTAVAALI